MSILTWLACWWLGIDHREYKRLAAAPRGLQSNDRIATNTAVSTSAPFPLKAPPLKVRQECANRLTYDEYKHLYPDLPTEINHWEFDVFALAEKCDSPLFLVTMTILDNEGLLEGWQVERNRLEEFLRMVEDQYLRNPYHNSVHAADVTQATAVMINHLPDRLLTKLDVFCAIIGAAVHDLSHPGVNNAFLVASKDPMAIIYNDKSVNENTHVSAAFRITQNPAANIFEGWSTDDVAQARRLLIDMVMSTDMAFHFDLLQNYDEAIKANPKIETWEDCNMVLQMILHLADLVNQARPIPQASRWARLVTTEFLLQGDMEEKAGLPVSPMCDKEKVDLGKGQLGFIKLFLRPTLEACRSMMPEFVELAIERCVRTEKYWSSHPARFPQDVKLLPLASNGFISNQADEEPLFSTATAMEG